MNDEIAIRVSNLSKCYHIYDAPSDRLKQFVLPRLKRLIRRPSRPYFRPFWALKDLSFEVRKGETVGIIGRNGSGKSTLLQILAGTLTPTSGEVNINGRVAALLELGSGFNPEFTGRENVFMAGQIFGMSMEEIAEILPDIESFADIGDHINQPVKTYSTGMQVRLAFSVATAKQPEILIVDEALSVGDAFFQHKCYSRIRRFQNQGTTLFFVSHDIAAVRTLCNRSIWLDNGIIRASGDTKTVIDSYMTEVYAKQQAINPLDDSASDSNPEGSAVTRPKRDCRLDFINQSNLRNDIEVFDFDEDAYRWGDGLAKINSIRIEDATGNPLSWTLGGEEVLLIIEATCKDTLHAVILGFMVRDRLGQNLFGDNTFLTTQDNPVSIRAQSTARAQFRFLMPILPAGSYAITAAIATGTQKDHIIHDWMNEALFFESHNGFTVSGLVGVPMHNISIEEAK